MSYQRWYRQGTVTLTAGATAVVGTTTAWAADIRPGDAITVDGTRWAEIDSVTDNTHLTLTQPWGGASGTTGYAIDRRSLLRQISSDAGARVADYIARLRAMPAVGVGDANKLMRANAAGNGYELIDPPRFYAQRTAGDITGPLTIPFNAVEYNVGNGYVPSSGWFYAPLTGNYVFVASGMAAATGMTEIRILVDAAVKMSKRHNATAYATQIEAVLPIHLNAGQQVVAFAQAGTFYGASFFWFSGMMVN